jgi:hypothetical protein
VQSQKDLLSGVLGVLPIPRQAERRPGDHGFMRPQQRLESRGIAGRQVVSRHRQRYSSRLHHDPPK